MSGDELIQAANQFALKKTRENFEKILAKKRIERGDKRKILLFYKNKQAEHDAHVTATMLEDLSLKSQRVILSYLYETCSHNSIKRHEPVALEEIEHFDLFGFRR